MTTPASQTAATTPNHGLTSYFTVNSARITPTKATAESHRQIKITRDDEHDRANRGQTDDRRLQRQEHNVAG